MARRGRARQTQAMQGLGEEEKSRKEYSGTFLTFLNGTGRERAGGEGQKRAGQGRVGCLKHTYFRAIKTRALKHVTWPAVALPAARARCPLCIAALRVASHRGEKSPRRTR